MSDFETHPRGTFAELQAARELARAIQIEIDTWGEGIIPFPILQPYKRLVGQYIRQIQSEEL